jgi:peptide/nickel transport system permease protein
MMGFILRRVLIAIPTLLVVSFLVFTLMNLAPGDFLDTARAQRDISPEIIQQLEKQYGLDRHWLVQYRLWLERACLLDFGYSWTYKVDVSDLIASRAPATLGLTLASMLVAWGLALPLGVLAAIYRNSIFDRVSAFLAYAAISIPEFFFALLALFFAATTGLLPTGGLTSITSDFLPAPLRVLDYLQHLFLPTLVLGLGGVAGALRLMRANFLDVIAAEFVTTARAKGLSERVIMFKHVLRNAINPFITSLGFAFSGLLSGALIVENIFNYPGLGQLTFQAFLRQDQYLVMTTIMLSAFMLIVGNLLADLLLAATDPRIRLERQGADPVRPGPMAAGLFVLLAAIIGLAFLPWNHPLFWKYLKHGGTIALLAAGVFVLRAAAPVIRRVLPQLLRRPQAVFALVLLATAYGAMFIGPFIAPYAPSDQNLQATYHPPISLTWKEGALHVKRTQRVDPTVAEYRVVPGESVPLKWFAAGPPYKILGLIPLDIHLVQSSPEQPLYLLGSDSTGRDIFSRLLYGASVSMSLGLIGVTITMTLGFFVGGLAGYLGGTFDNLAMRTTEVLMSIPGLYLLIALRSALAQHFESDEMFVLIVVILSFIGWAGTARVIRGMTLSLRERTYVRAAEAMGQSRPRILVRHILPNLASYLIIGATLSIPGYILGEAALSFLGLGIAEPAASWGLMLSQAQEIKVLMLRLTWLFAPGAAIFLVVMAFNLLGDALRDILDPKFRPGIRS